LGEVGPQFEPELSVRERNQHAEVNGLRVTAHRTMIDKLACLIEERTVTVIRSAEAPTFEVPGVQFVAFASPSRGSADVCTWRTTAEPNLVSPATHHIDRDEVFMVTSGQVRITPSGPLIEAGDAMVVPAGTPIKLENPTDVPAQAFVAIRSDFTATAEDGT